MTTLYKKSATGAMMYWEIEIGLCGLEIQFGQVGGAPQFKEVSIEENQSGRNWDEQAEFEMESRINKQRDKGYSLTKQQASQGATNTLGMPMPMLAKKHTEVEVPREFALQYKYDGNRCLITKKNGRVFAYSRNGKEIKSIDHILEQAKGIPEGMVLDGELYHHGTPLQTIRSWISRKQAESNNLEYIVYDIISMSGYRERFLSLKNLKLGYPIKTAITRFISTLDLAKRPLTDRLKTAINVQGYEGLIIRELNTPYSEGKRCKQLIKVKAWMDDEFVVENISASADGWGVLHMRARNGKRFRASAPGTHEEKRQVLQDKHFYKGLTVTVEYSGLTKDGIPFHPVAIAWRSSSD